MLYEVTATIDTLHDGIVYRSRVIEGPESFSGELHPGVAIWVRDVFLTQFTGDIIAWTVSSCSLTRVGEDGQCCGVASTSTLAEHDPQSGVVGWLG